MRRALAAIGLPAALLDQNPRFALQSAEKRFEIRSRLRGLGLHRLVMCQEDDLSGGGPIFRAGDGYGMPDDVGTLFQLGDDLGQIIHLSF